MNPRLRFLSMSAPVAASTACFAATTFPGANWAEGPPAELGLDPAQLEKAREYALGVALMDGKVVGAGMGRALCRAGAIS